MNPVPTSRKLGPILRVGARVATQLAGRSRTMGAITQAAQATVRSFSHVLHQLWLEVTGAVFIFMAAVGGMALVREWTKYQTGHTTSGRIFVAVCFTLTFVWFGLSSFWRVRQKGKARR